MQRIISVTKASFQ